jgi:hypothetical protein
MKNEEVDHRAARYSVLSQLLIKKFDVRVVVGRKRHINIFVFMPESERMYKLNIVTGRGEITKTKYFGELIRWTMNDSSETEINMNLLYCFVQISKKSEEMRYFVVPQEIVTKYNNDSHAYWLSQSVDYKNTPMRKFGLGFKGKEYTIKTPLVEEYEDRWDLLV